MLEDNIEKVTISETLDSKEEVRILLKKNFSAKKLLTEVLELLPHNKTTVDRKPFYVNSGMWSSHREKPMVHSYSVDVGCSHEWDCCGCLCGLYYKIHDLSDRWIVSSTMIFNY